MAPVAAVLLQGSEIIRLYHTLLGAEGFRKGMDLYFKRHDGQVSLYLLSMLVLWRSDGGFLGLVALGYFRR
jgi:hypothetical protein